MLNKNDLKNNVLKDLKIIYIEITDNLTSAAYIKGLRSCFTAKGYGYCKVSTVLTDFINYYCETKLKTWGEGVNSVINASKQNNIKVEFISETKSGKMFKIEKKGN